MATLRGDASQLSSPGGTRIALPQFLLLWWSSFVFYLSFHLLPVLPLYAPRGDRCRTSFVVPILQTQSTIICFRPIPVPPAERF